MAETARDFFKNLSDMGSAAGLVVIVMMMIIPLPTILLDLFMVLNLVFALLILLIVLYTKKATDFNIFPTMLLVSTLFSLGINISSTRLILTMGSKFDGKMVQAFGSFVTGSSGTSGLVIGLVIFIIIIAVQAMVITKGSTRVAEVAARFSLDALPGKQMAIDADYNSGAIGEEEMHLRKRELQREVDFYGAMDGSSKFVSGNVKVGIFITVVNILAGIVIGVTIHKESLIDAMNVYSRFTIGDGLLSQLPGLLVSTATGIIVTRSVSDGSFGSDAVDQFAKDGRIYWVGAGVLLLFSVIPGFPWYITLPMSGLLAYLAYYLGRKEQRVYSQVAQAAQEKQEARAQDEGSQMSPVVPLDRLSLELGFGLIPLVDKEKGAELLERVVRIRRESALDLGLVVPRIRIRDNIRLEPSEYCFKINGVDIGRGKIRMGYYLCINPGGIQTDIPGEKTRDPAFGLPALWVAEDKREEAEAAGFTVIDPPSIIATHLTEIIKRHADEILGRQETQSILDTLKKEFPAVVEDVLKHLSLGGIQKVLQALLREQVSIRNTVAILEALADYAPISQNPDVLVEKARQALARQICLQYADEDRLLKVITIDPNLEQKIIESRVETAGGAIAALDSGLQRAWIRALSRMVSSAQEQGYLAIVLCSEAARALVKSSSNRELPDLVVLSVPEIVNDVNVETIGEIRIDE